MESTEMKDRQRRRAVSMAAGVILAGALAAAGVAAVQDDDLVIGVSWTNFGQERLANRDRPALEAAVNGAGARLIERDANNSDAQQLADVASLIEDGADAIIMFVADPVAMLPAVDMAKEAGVPVIAYDRLIEDPSVLYISFDNEAVGALMADAITAAQPNGNYVIIKGDPLDPNSDFLRSGMDPVLTPLTESGAISIVRDEYSDGWSPDGARRITSEALAATDGDIQAIITLNDGMAGGVVAALADAGLEGSVLVSGQDGDTPALNRVALGTQHVTVLKDAFALGEVAGRVAVELARGTAPADTSIPDDVAAHAAPALGTAARPFTTPGGTVVSSIILSPTAVTRENLSFPVDIGWVSAAAICAGVPEGSVAPC